MSTLSSANVTDVNLVLEERTHMRLCLNMLIFTHNLSNWLIRLQYPVVARACTLTSILALKVKLKVRCQGQRSRRNVSQF